MSTSARLLPVLGVALVTLFTGGCDAVRGERTFVDSGGAEVRLDRAAARVCG